MGWEYSDEIPEDWEPPDDPWATSPFGGWREDLGRSTVDGVRQGSRAYILVPGNIQVNDEGVIPTDRMMLPAGASGDDITIYGFKSADPDDNPDTWEGGGLGVPGFSGEGVRGALASTTDEGEYVGEAEYARVFTEDVTNITLAHATMGLGFLELTTYIAEAGDPATEKLYFNYSNVGSEPKFRGSGEPGGILEIGDNYIRYFLENPWDYADEEIVSLNDKFGWDPTLGTGDFTNPLKDGFDRSIKKIVEALISTYPIDLATFPRTGPMKLRRKQIQLLRKQEELEEDDPLGTEAISSTISTDEGMEVEASDATVPIPSGGGTPGY